MKLMTGILAVTMMTGGVWAQNPNIINNVKNKMDAVQQKKADDSDAALEAAGVPRSTQATKPAAGAPASTVKPAAIPGVKPVAAANPASSVVAKPIPAPASKPAPAPVSKQAVAPVPASKQNNKLERVNVVRHADDFQIEISSHEAVTPRVSKLSSPARLVVELPGTAMATPQNKIEVGSAGVKDVRIGMDGKTPPTTSVVVDLEQACGYELTPGPGNQFVLTLHTQAVAKSALPPVPSKTSVPAPKLQNVSAKPAVTLPATAPKMEKVGAVAPRPTAKAAVPATKIAAVEKAAAAGKGAEAPKPAKPEPKKWAMTGKRDPFFSPVVQQTGGAGCSTGKKCLEIGQINVRGVVKSESGFIAVVTNSLNKAYFLHEKDPVFNGYVVRITGDSVVFQETVQDKLGKPLTREVVKRIVTPAV